MEKDKLLITVLISVFLISIIWIAFGAHPGEQEADVPDTTKAPIGTLYTNPDLGFQVSLPEGFVFNEGYVYEGLGPDNLIRGVEFRIPPSLSEGTNLSIDSHMAVERLNDVECRPSSFLYEIDESETKSLGGNTYQYAATRGAAAGNYYDESVYVTEQKGYCYALRYFLHSTNIGNYDPGTIREFNRDEVVAIFDSIASTLIILPSL